MPHFLSEILKKNRKDFIGWECTLFGWYLTMKQKMDMAYMKEANVKECKDILVFCLTFCAQDIYV